MKGLWTPPEHTLAVVDELTREREGDQAFVRGLVWAQMCDERGRIIGELVVPNIITNVGDQVYGEQGACAGAATGSIATPAAKPTGMKLGSGSTAVAKSGAGGGIVTYLSNSHLAFDASPTAYPTSALNASKRDIVYKCTYAAGKATTASAINEAVIVNEALTDATGAGAAATLSRVILAGIGSKGANDTLTITWTHTIGS